MLPQIQAREILTINTIVFGLLFIPSLLFAFTSLFMFDAPGSTENKSLWVIFFLLFTSPIAIIISIVMGWFLYNRQMFTLAIWISSIPWLYILVIILWVCILILYLS